MTDFLTRMIEGPIANEVGRQVGNLVPVAPTPTRPSAIPPGRPEPKPFVQGDLPTIRRVTEVSQESVDQYAAQDYSDDEGGPSGNQYAVKAAGPIDLTVTSFVRGTDRPEDVPGEIEPGFNVAYAGQLIEKGFGINQYRYNPLTGRVEQDSAKALSLALPSPISAAMGIGEALNRKNLQRIGRLADAQEEGYALGMLQGRVVGVSPSPFGGYTLSGVLPQNLTEEQRRTVAEQLLGISQKSRTEFAKQQEERQRRVEASQATQEETDAGAGLFQPGDQPATPDPRVTVPDTSYSGDESQFGAGSGGGGGSYFSDLGSSQPSDPGYSYSAYEPGGEYSSNSYSINSDPKPGGYSMRAEGGRVSMADGGSADPVQGNGFVDGSPDNYTESQTVADDEYRRVRPGSFVMNAPMTEKLQEAGLLPKGVDNPAKKSTIKANKGGMIDVALSKGEYVFEPEEAKEIGYDVLNKINNMGKPEVDRRQAARGGGFADGYQGGGEPQPAGTDLSRIPPLAAGLRPKIKRETKPEGFISTQPDMQDSGIPPMLINGIDIEQVGRALSLVETRGYEDRNDGYFYTRSDTKSNPSSAFGPLQITGDTLAAMLDESDELRIQMNEDINPGFANYLERYAADARNRTNFRAFGLIYEGEKGKKAKGRAPTATEKEMYKGLGAGSISLEDHKKYYPLLANLYLRYKAGMSDSEEDMVRRHFGNDKSTQKYRDAKVELGID